MAAESNNGWEVYQKLVLAKLNDHDALLKDIADELTDIKVEIGQLKIKAGLWGAVGASIPTIGAILFILLK